MLDILYSFFIQPLYLLFEFLFSCIFKLSNNILLTIFLSSLFVSLFCIPLFLKADKLKKEEIDIQKKLKKRTDAIKRNYKGDERFLLLQTFYRQNNYHPIMSLKMSLSLLLQIPIFIAAYAFFSNLKMLEGMQCLFIMDLSKADGLLKIADFKINLLPFLMTFFNLLAGFIYANNKSLKENKTLLTINFLFLVLLYNASSALVLYWTFNNIFSLVKNVWLKLFVKEVKNNGNEDKTTGIIYKNIFIKALIALWLFVGIFIPSNVVAKAPIEFFCIDTIPMHILIGVFTVATGLILFWGGCLFYFSTQKIRKVLSVATLLLLFYAIFNFLTLRLPNVVLKNNLEFDAGITSFGTASSFGNLLYILAIFTITCVLFFILFKKKYNILNNVLKIIIMSTLSVSLYNCYKVQDGTGFVFSVGMQKKSPDGKYIRLSKTKKNVLIIFADRAIGSYLPIIFSENPKLLDSFSGFTYYPNALSYATYTLIGYLPILGGYEYTPLALDEKEGKFDKKFGEALTMLPLIFKENNWNSTVINPVNMGWDKELWGGVTKKQAKEISKSVSYERNGIDCYSIPRSITETIEYNGDLLKANIVKRNLFYYSLFCASPVFLKNILYDSGKYHNLSVDSLYAYTSDFIKSYAELFNIAKLTDFSQTKDTFVVYNNLLTHTPGMLKYPNYDLSKDNQENYKSLFFANDNNYSLKHYHANFAFIKLVAQYLDFLKENNVYDNTRIIIVSDHGFGFIKNPYLPSRVIEKNYIGFNPLLMVKDFNSNERVKISDEFMTNADVPSIALDGIVDNPKNPYSGKKITNKGKQAGILIKFDVDWQPVHYFGKEKILNDDNYFLYVSENPMIEKNWYAGISYREALELNEKMKKVVNE